MKTIIVGAGQNGMQVFNILKHDPKAEIVGFLDDTPEKWGTMCCGRPVLGPLDMAEDLRRAGSLEGAIVAIGRNAVRARLTGRLQALGVVIATAIHPQAFIDDSASVGEGSILEMGVMIHPEARLGRGVFVGGSSVVAHHCVVGDFSLLGGGVTFGGDVIVGELSTLGVGTVLQPHIRIGRNVTTGIATAVTKDLPDNSVAVGVPAKIIRLAAEA